VITDSAIGYGELRRYDPEAVGVAGWVGGRHGNCHDTGEQSDDHSDGWFAHNLNSFHWSIAVSNSRLEHRQQRPDRANLSVMAETKVGMERGGADSTGVG
jgi:hypothetical protein